MRGYATDRTLHSAALATATGDSLPVIGLSTVAFQVTGTFVATVTFQGTIDSSTWVSILARNVATGTVAATATAAGVYVASCGGLSEVRANMAWTSGTSITVVALAQVPGMGDAAYALLMANSGVDIGDVDVTSVIPGTGATHLGKAEDAAHTTGDTGVMALAVRQDIPGVGSGTDGDYTHLSADQYGRLRVNTGGIDWSSMIGQIELRADNSGWAVWERVARQAKYVLGTDPNRHFRQGPWAIHMNGGPQAGGEDWASVHIPINEMYLTDLDEIQYTYYKFLAGTADVGVYSPNIVISVHDPDDHDIRADINVAAGIGDGVGAGWHETIFTAATNTMFWFGNGVVGSGIAEGGAHIHSWSDFQADAAFSTFTVYRIMIDYGYWGSTRSTGDLWIGSIQINNIAVKMEPTDLNDLGTRKNLTGSPFGEPTLMSSQNSDAVWSRANATETVASLQKGSTGWLANLYGGLQTNGRSVAAVYIPVNELPVPLFSSARWTYWFSAAEEHGVNMVIWAHDPYDFDKRAEITQGPSVAGLARASGWNAHELNQTTDQFFYMGENEANSNLSEGTAYAYGWDDFQGDEMFNTWTIYRVSFEYGYYDAVATFADAWVADISLNNEQIALKPDSSGTGRIGHRHYNVASGDLDGSLAPKTLFRLLSLDIHVSATPNGGELFTITKDAWQGISHDTVIFSNDLGANALTSLYQTFEGMEMFLADDILGIFHTNSQDDDFGVTVMYQTVFGGM